MNIKLQSQHCALCTHEHKDLNKGLICGVTRKKPDFNNCCLNIDLSEKFRSLLELLILDFEILKQSRSKIHTRFYISIGIGFILIAFGHFFMEWAFFSMYAYWFKLSCIFAGISFISVAYAKLNAFRSNIKALTLKKKSIDDTLGNYHIRYTSKVRFNPKVHGIQEAIVELEFKNWRHNQTSTTYNINSSRY